MGEAGILINTVAPGRSAAPAGEPYAGGSQPRGAYFEHVALGRFAQIADIAEAVVYCRRRWLLHNRRGVSSSTGGRQFNFVPSKLARLRHI